MKKTESKPTVIKDETRTCDGITYRYLLTENKSRRVASYLMPLYSIKVEMDEGGNVSESEIKDIFADIGKALTFYDGLVENLATPIDLPYILEDKISL